MSSSEVNAIARAGVQIELHTHRHRTPRDRDLFEREVRDNRERIREYTGSEPLHFCYPSGVTSPQFLPWLRECGVKSATTCNHGLSKPGCEPLMLPRFLDSSAVDDIDFESRYALARAELARVTSPAYLEELVGTIGADPFHGQIPVA